MTGGDGGILDAIDGAVEDWATSVDAMRWSPGAVDARRADTPGGAEVSDAELPARIREMCARARPWAVWGGDGYQRWEGSSVSAGWFDELVSFSEAMRRIASEHGFRDD